MMELNLLQKRKEVIHNGSRTHRKDGAGLHDFRPRNDLSAQSFRRNSLTRPNRSYRIIRSVVAMATRFVGGGWLPVVAMATHSTKGIV